MPELNTNIPLTVCKLRAEYLYNGTKHAGELIPCLLFGAASVPGHAIGFHCMLHNGALIYRLPISAFVHRDDAPNIPLEHLELWDCLSEIMSCIEYEFLAGLRCDVLLRDRTWHEGVYRFTLDWHGSALADDPGEAGHKCAHVIALHNGCFAAQPNNRIKWYEPSFITVPFPERPDYETNNTLWRVENKGPKWVTENTERMFYDVGEEGRGET